MYPWCFRSSGRQEGYSETIKYQESIGCFLSASKLDMKNHFLLFRVYSGFYHKIMEIRTGTYQMIENRMWKKYFFVSCTVSSVNSSRRKKYVDSKCHRSEHECSYSTLSSTVDNSTNTPSRAEFILPADWVGKAEQAACLPRFPFVMHHRCDTIYCNAFPINKAASSPLIVYRVHGSHQFCTRVVLATQLQGWWL